MHQPPNPSHAFLEATLTCLELTNRAIACVHTPAIHSHDVAVRVSPQVTQGRGS